MRHASRLLPALLVVALAACAPRVLVEQDTNAHFSGYHRYAWLSPPPGPVKDPILDSQILDSRIHQAVVSTLARRGYQEVGQDTNPDFVVTYHVTMQDVSNPDAGAHVGFVDTFPGSFSSVIILPLGGNTVAGRQGTLILDIIDGRSKRLVWRGWISNWVNQDNYSPSSVTHAVAAILARFPGS